MARELSIPHELYEPILRRWAQGKTEEEILQWIQELNKLRDTPVETSRSSIHRFIENGHSLASAVSPLRVVSFARRRALENWNKLEEIQGRYVQLARELNLGKTSEERRIAVTRYNSEMKSLRHQERLAERMLRLAGVGSAGGEQALDQEMERLEQNTIKDDAAEEAAVPLVESELSREELLALPAKVPPRLAAEAAAVEDSVRLSSANAAKAEPVHASKAVRPKPGRALFRDIPFVQDPGVKLTAAQQEAWKGTRVLFAAFLVAAWRRGAPALAPLQQPLPPVPETSGEERALRYIPNLKIPEGWVLTLDQRQRIEEQLKHVNAWMQWLRASQFVVDEDEGEDEELEDAA